MLHQISNPFRAFYVCLPTGNGLHVLRIHNDSLEIRLFQNVVQGFPI